MAETQNRDKNTALPPSRAINAGPKAKVHPDPPTLACNPHTHTYERKYPVACASVLRTSGTRVLSVIIAKSAARSESDKARWFPLFLSALTDVSLTIPRVLSPSLALLFHFPPPTSYLFFASFLRTVPIPRLLIFLFVAAFIKRPANKKPFHCGGVAGVRARVSPFGKEGRDCIIHARSEILVMNDRSPPRRPRQQFNYSHDDNDDNDDDDVNV